MSVGSPSGATLEAIGAYLRIQGDVDVLALIGNSKSSNAREINPR